MLSDDRPYLFGKRRTFVVMTGVVLSIFVASINQAMLVVSVPKIVGDLGGLESFGWIFTSYFLASTITIPIWGKLSDQYGRRPLLALAVLAFLAGSLVCAFAPTLEVLFVGRVLQGVGAGGIVPIAMATTADIMAPRERGKWIGYQSAVLLGAQIGGPTIGGVITDVAGWRWAFFISLPFGVVALVIVWFALKIPANASRHSLDYVGAALLTGALITGLLAATWGGKQYPWGSSTIVAMFACSGVLLVAFAWWERRVEEPILPLELYRNRTFVAGQIIVFASGCCMWAVQTYMPLLVQGSLGYSATRSGMILLPYLFSFFLAATLLGQIMSRTGRYRWQLFVGPIVTMVGFVLLTRMDPIPSDSDIVRNMLICGVGLAMGNAILIIVQNATPQKMMGVVSAGNQFARTIGGTIMLTVLGAVMTSSVQSELARELPSSSLGSTEPEKLIAHQVQLNGQQADVVHRALGASIPKVFYVVMPIIVISFLAAFLVERRALRDTIVDDEQGIGDDRSQWVGTSRGAESGTPVPSGARGL